MKRSHLSGLFVLCLVCVIGLFGCQQRPVVPTVAFEPTEPVVVVVVTATSLPTLAPTNTAVATITPIPTLTPVITPTETVTAQVQVTRAPTVVAQATLAPQPTSQVPTESPPTAPPSSFPAPNLLAPEGKAFRDGDTIIAQFSSVGPLAPDQCYRLDMTLAHPSGPGGVGDWWVGLCGDQSAPGSTLSFPIKAGRFRNEPNYGTLLASADSVIPPTPEYNMQWFVSVVRILNNADPVHPELESLSAASASLQNTFFR